MDLANDVAVLAGVKKAPGTENGKNKSEGKKVLIVEDDTSLANILEDKLKEQGFTVEKASNGKEGLEKASSFEPHLILLDLLMPVMGGQAMLTRLRELEKFKTLPVVVLTNAGDVENMQGAHFKNAYFLIKSNVSLAEIMKSVQDLI